MEFYSKNKFEKVVHLVGFITRIYHDAQSLERQIFLSVGTFHTMHRKTENSDLLYTNADSHISPTLLNYF